ncbi:response regulator transcription factor [Leptospira idonii]|uniref:DNA-binding response regulator n=1 Tax=Leptospira idonii TaxID=1193500 RepID=A0A4R9M1V0_9LEPT|nr:response regulator transcription factor [Leptospira idonii]TGN20754.1 DNA-binding response regulator [Leptospira idonii]
MNDALKKVILLLEDDLSFAHETISRFQEEGNGYKIIHFTSFRDFSANQPEHVDLVYLDLGLPDVDGLEIIPYLSTRYAGAKISVLSIFQDEERVFQAIRHGACGYIWKSDVKNLPETSKVLLEEGVLLTQSIALRIIKHFQTPASQNSIVSVLTEREKQILDRIVNGENTKDISLSLGTSDGTVRNQLKSIYRKLEVKSKSELILKFKR